MHAAPSAFRARNPQAPRIIPPAALPKAPIRPMMRSPRPWNDVRSDGESASVRSALPATNARFQPMPFRKSPSITRPLLLPGARPAMATATSSTTPPRPITGSRPSRSDSQPDSGEVMYMPPRCTATASPIVPT